MNHDFHDLAAEVRATWSDDARRVYESASARFQTEIDQCAELGAALAAARKAKGLTQPALSQLTGIQQAEISRIENGIGNPTVSTLLRLTDALGQRLVTVAVAPSAVDPNANVLSEASGRWLTADDVERAADAVERDDREIDERGAVYPGRIA